MDGRNILVDIAITVTMSWTATRGLGTRGEFVLLPNMP